MLNRRGFKSSKKWLIRIDGIVHICSDFTINALSGFKQTLKSFIRNFQSTLRFYIKWLFSKDETTDLQLAGKLVAFRIYCVSHSGNEVSCLFIPNTTALSIWPVLHLVLLNPRCWPYKQNENDGGTGFKVKKRKQKEEIMYFSRPFPLGQRVLQKKTVGEWWFWRHPPPSQLHVTSIQKRCER